MTSALTIQASRCQLWRALDARSKPAYLLIGTIILIGFAATVAGDFHFSDATFVFEVAGLILFVLFEAYALRLSGWPRIASAIETTLLTATVGFATSLALIPVTAFSGPLRDGLLIRGDIALGYHWLLTYRAVASDELLMTTLRIAYHSFIPEGAGILVVLCVAGHFDRAWRLVTATCISLLLTITLYPFFVADAAYNHFGIVYGDHFATTIHNIKAGDRVISRSQIGGLVTFPSYHVAAAVLSAWAAWPLRPLRWPMIAFNVVVSASAIFIGAHYLVDVLGGAAVACLSVYLGDWMCGSSINGRKKGRKDIVKRASSPGLSRTSQGPSAINHMG